MWARLHDWKPFAELTATGTVVNSSNICGIKIGERLGSKGLKKTLDEFGFESRRINCGLSRSNGRRISTTEQLSEEDYVALIATGYTVQPGFNVTPLEIVQAYGAIANDGKLMKAISSDQPDSAATMVRQVLSAHTASGMKTVLQKVVLEGTGKLARSRLYSTAGKTGTAFRPGAPDHDSLGGAKGIASFAGLHGSQIRM